MDSDKFADYYWTFKELTDLFNTIYEYKEEDRERKRIERAEKQKKEVTKKVKKNVKKQSKYYSEKFTSICRNFDLGEIFKSSKNEDSKNNASRSYIFPKCLACKIIFSLNQKREILQDFKDMETEVLKKNVLENICKVDKQLFVYITDKDFENYLKQECPMLRPDIKEDEEWCELYLHGKCVPNLILRLFELYRISSGEKKAFSTLELEEAYDIFCTILSSSDSKEEYKSSVKETIQEIEKGKEKNEKDNESFITSANVAIYGTNQDLRIKVKLKEKFRDYYIEQCKDIEKMKQLYMRLSNYYDLNKESWKPEVLVSQVEYWKEKWLYVFERFNNLRIEEKKHFQKDKLIFDILLRTVLWEVSYENFEINSKISENKNKADEVIGDDDKEHYKAENTKMREEGKDFIERFIVASKEKKELLESDIEELYIEAFSDLEKVIEYISVGWKNPTRENIYNKNIIKYSRENNKKINMLQGIEDNDLQ